MTAPIDIDALRRTIAAARPGCPAAEVSREYLEQIERELTAGRAAIAELAMRRTTDVLIESIEAGRGG